MYVEAQVLPKINVCLFVGVGYLLSNFHTVRGSHKRPHKFVTQVLCFIRMLMIGQCDGCHGLFWLIAFLMIADLEFMGCANGKLFIALDIYIVG